MVPVVHGGRNTQDCILILTLTADTLANYLIYLDQSNNDNEYLKYFEWEKKYRLINDKVKRIGWCNLCQRVYEHLRKGSCRYEVVSGSVDVV